MSKNMKKSKKYETNASSIVKRKKSKRNKIGISLHDYLTEGLLQWIKKQIQVT